MMDRPKIVIYEEPMIPRGGKPQKTYTPKHCEHCGGVLSVRQIRYCGAECRRRALLANFPQKPCEDCGAMFTPKRSGSRFCSESCKRRTYYRERVDLKAKRMQKHFEKLGMTS